MQFVVALVDSGTQRVNSLKVMLHSMPQELMELRSFRSKVESVENLILDRHLVSSAKKEGERIIDDSREIVCINYER